MADLHSHALMSMYYWRKTLDTRGRTPWLLPYLPTSSHIDVPRIRESGVKLLTFAVYAFFRWPHRDCFETAKAQIALFEGLVARHPDVLVHAKTPAEIQAAVAGGKIAAVLALEGGHHVGNDPANLAYFKQRGVFYITLTHFINTPVGDTYLASRFTRTKGLRAFGRRLIGGMEKAGLIVDVAHSSEKGFWDVMEVAKRAPIYSHGGAKSVCRHDRHLTDDQSREIIRRDGLLGVILYPHYLRIGAVWGKMEDVFRHLDHWLSLGGEDHVAIGSDMGGVVLLKEIGDIAGMPRLHDALVKRFGETLSRKILFDNAMGYLKRNWPGGPDR